MGTVEEFDGDFSCYRPVVVQLPVGKDWCVFIFYIVCLISKVLWTNFLVKYNESSGVTSDFRQSSYPCRRQVTKVCRPYLE